ncbi:MAG: hypothetical protein JWQ02_2319 [Capsulimonas sp.]|nr:hypothetical protein [Capsulimonas sp.]
MVRTVKYDPPFDEAIFTGTPQSIVSELQDAYDALKTANGIRNGPP